MKNYQLLAEIDSIADERRCVVSDSERKGIGQFFTPPPIAAAMADLLVPDPLGGVVHVMDPGAGVGTLGIAAAMRLLASGASSVHVTAVELQSDTSQLLKEALTIAADRLGPGFSFEVLEEDFLDFAVPRLGGPRVDSPDVVIANPPYFKMPAADPRGGGAPNAYARFMAVSQALLRPAGQLCLIIPRSYTSGSYFRKFRHSFHSEMSISAIHLFDSRRDAFRSDRVLQENIIMHCVKSRERNPAVTITTSSGRMDVGDSSRIVVPEHRVVNLADHQSWVHLPASQEDLAVLTAIEALPESLDTLGFAISTGPVVPFRAREYLSADPVVGGYPLLWLQHVRRDGVTWPMNAGFRKQQYLRSMTPESLLTANSNQVLLRRFSAKEDQHRLVAACLEGGSIPGNFIGIENHLNTIYGKSREMNVEEIAGIAALLNSDSYDRYIRIVNGNTQVSASEIRAMPMPSHDDLLRIGSTSIADPDTVQRVVEEVVGVAS